MLYINQFETFYQWRVMLHDTHSPIFPKLHVVRVRC